MSRHTYPLSRAPFYLSFFCFIFFAAPAAFAQIPGTVTGIITDAAGSPLPGAEAVLLHPKDSTLISGAVSDARGKFTLSNGNGVCLLRIRYLGYADYFKQLSIDQKPVWLGKIPMTEQNTQIKTVQIEDKVPTAVVKGDTTEFNAKAFKTHPDANVEDLVSKMPGITTQNGKIQAQGEDVKQVLVDGKPFMGDDPNAVLKNLPADVVDKIQVFDKTSDQAQFTGFDDGNTSKTLNIITLKRFRNGTFGRLYAGYGQDDHYKAGGSVNIFKDKRRISILGQFNNINDQNFSTEDLLGVMAGGGGQGGGRGGGGFGGGRNGGGGQQNDASSFLVAQQSGLTNTRALGVNYSDKWGSKTDVTASYFINYTGNNALSDIYRQYFSKQNAGLNYLENDNITGNNVNHRFNLRLETQIDSFNSILIQPKLSLQQNWGNQVVAGQNQLSGARLNDTRNALAPNLTGFNGNLPVLLRHKFAKKGRTISLQVTPGYNTSQGDSRLTALSRFYTDTLSTADSLNQRSNLNKVGKVLSSNLQYTELLSESSQLSFNYAINYNNNNSDKKTYDNRNQEDSLVSKLSNVFNSVYLTQSGGAAYRYHKGIANASVGVAYQWAELKNEQQFPLVAGFRKTFESVLPNAMLQLRFSKEQNLRIFYRTSNNPPGIDQLQNVVNNNNPLQLSAGNPDLKQDFQHSLNIRYNVVKTATSRSFFVLLGGSATHNYVGNNTWLATKDTTVSGIQVARGAQFSRPTNLQGYYNLRSFVNYSFPVFAKKININLNTGVTYSRTPGLINGLQNNAGSTSVPLGAVISSNISEKFDFTLSSSSSFNQVRNDLQANLNSHYFSQSSRIKLNILPWKGLVLQSDLTHQYTSGLSQTYNQNYFLWNAAIGYKFLKNKQADLRLVAYDLLKQNVNIQRTTTDLYLQDARYNTLQRYYMLVFTYTLKQFPTQPRGEFPGGRGDGQFRRFDH
jgi:hypothetical protein